MIHHHIIAAAIAIGITITITIGVTHNVDTYAVLQIMHT